MARVTRTTSVGGVDMIGDLCAPEGSFAWCVAMKNEIEWLIHDHNFNDQQLTQCVEDFRAEEAWKLLPTHLDSRQNFTSYEQFCTARIPFGWGIEPEVIDAIIGERKATVVEELRKLWKQATEDERRQFRNYIKWGKKGGV